jgi:hypothetical protein
MESHLEARLWNDVFIWAQAKLSIPRGSIRATVLIETILAAFEMEEILYELREHSSGKWKGDSLSHTHTHTHTLSLSHSHLVLSSYILQDLTLDAGIISSVLSRNSAIVLTSCFPTELNLQ